MQSLDFRPRLGSPYSRNTRMNGGGSPAAAPSTYSPFQNTKTDSTITATQTTSSSTTLPHCPPSTSTNCLTTTMTALNVTSSSSPGPFGGHGLNLLSAAKSPAFSLQHPTAPSTNTSMFSTLHDSITNSNSPVHRPTEHRRRQQHEQQFSIIPGAADSNHCDRPDSRSMSRRTPRRPHPSGGGTPLPTTVSEAMEVTAGGIIPGGDDMDTM